MNALFEENLTEMTLADLVRLAQEGDRTAFGEIARRFERAVYAIALRRLGNHAEAQELAQEVFIRALRKIGQLRAPNAFAGWLQSIADRMAINRAVRRRPLSVAAPETMEAACVERSTPLSTALDRERAGQVRAGLNRLGRLDRETLLAFYFDGQSLIEMSDQFRSPVGTIKRRLHVARKRLAVQLEELAAV